MKQKRLLVATVVFFLIINTTFLWEAQLGWFHLLLSIFLFFYFLVLSGFLVGQLFAAYDEKLKDKRRLYLLAMLVFTLVSTVLYPKGMINLDNWGSPTVLIAQMEGAANCTTTLKLKKDNTFVERIICFGITESKGRYHMKGDSIFFHSVESGRNNGNFYKYAVLKRPAIKSQGNLGALECYERLTDTIGLPMMIIKDKLIGPH
jgi:hypothetical protein